MTQEEAHIVRAVLYARYSSDNQGGASIEDQGVKWADRILGGTGVVVGHGRGRLQGTFFWVTTPKS